MFSLWLLPQAYAVGFFAIPLVRWLRNKSRNAKIEQENADRRQVRLWPRPVAFAMLIVSLMLRTSAICTMRCRRQPACHFCHADCVVDVEIISNLHHAVQATAAPPNVPTTCVEGSVLVVQAAAMLGRPRPALDAKLQAARQLGKSSQRVISERVRTCRVDSSKPLQ